MYLEINSTKEHKEALEWFQNLINNSLRSTNPNAQAVSHILTVWSEILDSPVEPVAEEPVRKAPVKRKAKAKKKAVIEDSPFECLDHRTYGGKNRPTRDCPKCWSVYKQLHPLDYAIKRRDFERSMSA